MPSHLSRLLRTLNQDAVIRPDSTQAICDAIAASTAFQKPPKSLRAPAPKVPEVLDPLAAAEVRPIEILQTLGVAMLPPLHVEENLASWHWTLVRYGYLIEPGSNAPLATNSLAGDYRHHHMTALSEAIGVACALGYAKAWLMSEADGATIRDPLDFEYLLDPSYGPLPGAAAPIRTGSVSHASRRPDYLVVAEDSAGAVRLLVVECKGNSGAGRSVSIAQLGSAMHQLEGVRFDHGNAPFAADRHAYSTRLTKAGSALEVTAVDPREDGERWVQPRLRHREAEGGPIGEVTPEGTLVTDPSDVASRAVNRLDERTFAWSGGGGRSVGRALGDLRRHETEFGDIAGATSSFRLPNGQMLEVFSGALVSALEAASTDDALEARETRARIRRSVEETRVARRVGIPDDRLLRTSVPLARDEDVERTASALSENGLAFRVSLA